MDITPVLLIVLDGFHEALGKGRMRVNHVGHIRDSGTYLHRQGGFMDEIRCMRSQDMGAENPIGILRGNDLHETLNISRRLRLA